MQIIKAHLLFTVIYLKTSFVLIALKIPFIFYSQFNRMSQFSFNFSAIEQNVNRKPIHLNTIPTYTINNGMVPDRNCHVRHALKLQLHNRRIK